MHGFQRSTMFFIFVWYRYLPVYSLYILLLFFSHSLTLRPHLVTGYNDFIETSTQTSTSVKSTPLVSTAFTLTQYYTDAFGVGDKCKAIVLRVDFSMGLLLKLAEMTNDEDDKTESKTNGAKNSTKPHSHTAFAYCHVCNTVCVVG